MSRTAPRKASQVQTMLQQASLERGLQHDPSHARRSVGGGAEFSRLRDSMRQLRAEANGGLARDTDLHSHVNAQVLSIQRAFETLSETLEDEVSALRAADGQQWEQLKVHASQFNESAALRTQIEALAAEQKALRSAQTEGLRGGEHARLGSDVATVQKEIDAVRESVGASQQAASQRGQRLHEELAALRRWRADVVQPYIESSSKTLLAQGQAIDKGLPAQTAGLRAIEAEVSTAFPEVQARLDELATAQQQAAEETARLSAQLAQLTDGHNYAVGRLEAAVRRGADQTRANAEGVEARLRALATDAEQQAEAARQLGAAAPTPAPLRRSHHASAPTRPSSSQPPSPEPPLWSGAPCQ